MEYRILVVCQRFWPENQKLLDICEGFIERGVKVDLLCGQPYFANETKRKKAKNDNRFEIIRGIRVFRTYESDAGDTGSLGLLFNCLSFRLSSVAKLKELEKIRYDKIFIYQVSPITMCAAGIKLGQKRNIDVTLFACELWPHIVMDELDVRNGLFRRFLEKVSAHYYLAADKIIVNSPNTKKYFEKELGMAEDKVVYIPQSAERIYENPTPDDDLMERFAGSFKIVYAGEISRRQRFNTMIRAAERIKSSGIKNIRYVIVGDGPDLDRFKERVKERGLERDFFFEGRKSEQDISRYLSIADALIDTRRHNEAEDFYVPGTLASYMASGKPLILAMGGDAKDIVKEAGCGFVCEPEDDESVAENILRLYSMNRKDRNVIARKAREYQLEHFDRDKNIVRLMEEIHSTTKENVSENDKIIETAAVNEGKKEQKDYNWIDDDFK